MAVPEPARRRARAGREPGCGARGSAMMELRTSAAVPRGVARSLARSPQEAHTLLHGRDAADRRRLAIAVAKRLSRLPQVRGECPHFSHGAHTLRTMVVDQHAR